MKPNIRSSKIFQVRALKSKALTILLSIIFLVIVGAAAYALIYKGSNRASDGTVNSTNLSDIDRNKIIKEVSSKAEVLLADNKKEEAIKLYEQKIKQSNDAELKDGLIMNKATIHRDDKNYSVAVDDIKNITNPTKSSDIEEYIALTYRAAGDISQAIYHYQRAIEYVPDNYVMSGGEIRHFEGIINELKAMK